MSREKREVIPVISLMASAYLNGVEYKEWCPSVKVRELEADYTKLQEERDKAVELLREVQQENKCNFFDCDCASCNAEKFLASIDKEKG